MIAYDTPDVPGQFREIVFSPSSTFLVSTLCFLLAQEEDTEWSPKNVEDGRRTVFPRIVQGP